MPTYEYECQNGHVFEQMRDMDLRNAPTTCPVCRKPGVRKLSAPGVIFKGTGFYETDYRRKRKEES